MTLRKHANTSPTSSRDEPHSLASLSPLAELYRDANFRLEWDNDLGFHLARNLLRLRRHRGLTQAELAELVSTSQSKVARIEGGDENVTLRTIERLADALRGRLRLSIEPAEFSFPQMPPWWVCLEHGVALGEAEWCSPVIRTDIPARSGAPTVVAGWTPSQTLITAESGHRQVVLRTSGELTTGTAARGNEDAVESSYDIVSQIARSWS